MLRLHHIQKDPLALFPLSEDRIDYHWEWISKNKDAFDDYTPYNYDEFVEFISSSEVMSWEVGQGVGLCSLAFISPINPVIHMVMYDYSYRILTAHMLCVIAFNMGATRVSSLVTEDRLVAKDYVRRAGAEYEGTIRKAFLRNDKYLDVEIYGLLKEKFQWQEL